MLRSCVWLRIKLLSILDGLKIDIIAESNLVNKNHK